MSIYRARVSHCEHVRTDAHERRATSSLTSKSILLVLCPRMSDSLAGISGGALPSNQVDDALLRRSYPPFPRLCKHNRCRPIVIKFDPNILSPQTSK
jgi:hypothetical protein